MTILYKLTDEEGQSHKRTQWGVGVTHTASGVGQLCGPGWIHAYTDPLLAVLFNPIHANFHRPSMRLWAGFGKVGLDDSGTKCGTHSLTITHEMNVPSLTAAQRVRFGVLCAMGVYSDIVFTAWAQSWLMCEDRSTDAARAVADAAARAVADAAAHAAHAARAARAAHAAAYAVYAAYAAYAALYAAYAADAAAHAASTIKTNEDKPLDLAVLAHRAQIEETALVHSEIT